MIRVFYALYFVARSCSSSGLVLRGVHLLCDANFVGWRVEGGGRHVHHCPTMDALRGGYFWLLIRGKDLIRG